MGAPHENRPEDRKAASVTSEASGGGQFSLVPRALVGHEGSPHTVALPTELSPRPRSSVPSNPPRPLAQRTQDSSEPSCLFGASGAKRAGAEQRLGLQAPGQMAVTWLTPPPHTHTSALSGEGGGEQGTSPGGRQPLFACSRVRCRGQQTETFPGGGGPCSPWTSCQEPGAARAGGRTVGSCCPHLCFTAQLMHGRHEPQPLQNTPVGQATLPRWEGSTLGVPLRSGESRQG